MSIGVFRRRSVNRGNGIRPQRHRLRLALRGLEDRLAPATFTVSNLFDGTVAAAGDLPGSLRQAIFDANALAGTDIIDLTGVSGTIGLSDGHLTVSDSATFTGPGAAKLTVSGGGLSRIFDVSDAKPNVLAVSMSGLTLTGGVATDSNGGAIRCGNESLTLDGMVITGNSLAGLFALGGGIALGADGLGASLTVNNSTISDNSAAIGSGGGIHFAFPSAAGNQLTITNSTVSGNVARQRGGGIYFSAGGYAASSLDIRNSTISGNVCYDEMGGGLIVSGTSYAALSIRNSTIAANRALAAPGGGGLALNFGDGTIDIESTIIADNSGPPTAPDILVNTNTKINSTNNLIGSLTGIGSPGTNFVDLGGTVFGAAKLAPLANNGGPTRTQMPTPGSAAINKGSNPAPALTTDQRGAGFLRQMGAAVDIGAAEVNSATPFGTATAADVTTSGGTIYTFTVTYTDDVAIKVSTLGNADIRVTGPGGFDAPATFVKVDNNTNGTPRVATYSVTPPAGSWDFTDNGTYSIVLQANEVTDTAGNPVVTDVVGQFRVAIGRSLVVTSAADSGPGSLREAIGLANQNAFVADTITFDTVQMGTSTIAVASNSALLVSDPVTITAASPVTLDGGQLTRLIVVAGPGAMSVSISGMTFTNGFDDFGGGGGAIAFDNENLTLTNCLFTNNATGDTNSIPGGAGGAVAGFGFFGGSLTVVGCTFDGNVAGGGNVFNRGGAIATTGIISSYDVVIQNSSFINNSTIVGDGGAFAFGNGSVLIEGCTFSGNTASVRGGAISGGGIMNAKGFTIRNSTISGNKSFSAGGGLHVDYLNVDAHLINCTVTNNTNADVSGQFSGGGIAWGAFGGALNLTNTVVAKNINVAAPDIASTGPVTANTSLIGVTNGLTVNGLGNILGTKSAPANPFLAPLANNGGPTQTHRPYAGSPLVNAGPATSPLAFDQRGPGFPRVQGGKVDIGAVEVDPNIPSAVTSLTKISVPGGTIYTINVTYADDVAIKVSTLDSNDIRVTGPNGFDILATFKSVDNGTNGSPRVATYEFTPPGGSWDGGDDGFYTVSVEPNQVSDTAGNFVEAHALGIFQVGIPLNLVVTNANDSGPGSLRDALALANNNLNVTDTITFDPGFFATPRTITLTGGELLISDALIISNAAGAKFVTLRGVSSRIFTVDTPDTGAPVSIAGLTMTEGTGLGSGLGFAGVSGGAVMNQDEALTITGCVITGNSALDNTTFPGFGGGIFVATSAGSLTLADSTLSGNAAVGAGGGLAVFYNSTVTITNCTISTNRAVNGGSGGGIYLNSGGTLVVDGTTIADNFAAAVGTDGGGGLSVSGSATVTVSNSTISGNSTDGSGGGIRQGSTYSTVTVRNSTIAFNAARVSGGGVFRSGYAAYSGVTNLVSVIIAGNKNLFTPDLGTNSTVAFKADNCLIGAADTVPVTGSANTTGTLAAPLDALLGPLTLNGGTTATHLPRAGSPALNAGANPAALGTDQRGQPRTQGPGTDIGAVEVNPGTPAAAGTFAAVTVAGGTSYTLTLTFTDDTAVNVSTLGNGDVRVTGPGGFNVLATFVKVDVNTNGTPRVATYTFTPPGGAWDAGDDGVYSVSIEPNQVADTSGNFVPASAVNSIRVAMPRTFVVTNDADSGPGSLRDAIAQANANAGVADIITFDPAFFSTPRTISLIGGQLLITDPVTVTGPGAAKVTVDAGLASRILAINLPAAEWGRTVNLTGLTLANGGSVSSYGAGIANESAALVIDSCIITGCKNDFIAGGAISLNSIYAPLTLINSTLDGNSAYQAGAIYVVGGIPSIPDSLVISIQNSMLSNNTTAFGGGGGAIVVEAGGTALIQSSTLSGNTADGNGGAVFISAGGRLSLESSTLSGNASKSMFTGGGAIFLTGTATGTVSNSTISGNTADESAGGILAFYFDGTLTVRNSTIAFNSAVSTGGGITFFGGAGQIILTSTIVANNVAPLAPDLESGSPAEVFTANFSLIGKTDGATIAGANNITGTVAAPLDPIMDPALANNGGPTATHALLAGSPAINKGSNPAGLSFDQRGPAFNRAAGVAADIGAFESQVGVAPPTVSSLQINGGAAQRSMVTSIKVTFSTPVSFPAGLASAFTLTRTGPGGPTGTVNLAFSVSGNTVTITFATGGAVGIGPGGSLIDGNYDFTVVAANVLGAGGTLDGNANGGSQGTPFDDATTSLHRLFGDADGDRDVDAVDYGAFRGAFGTGNPVFDFDGDGDVDAVDFGAFRARFGTSV